MPDEGFHANRQSASHHKSLVTTWNYARALYCIEKFGDTSYKVAREHIFMIKPSKSNQVVFNQLRSIPADARIDLRLQGRRSLEAWLYIYDTQSQCIVVYGGKAGNDFTDLRIISLAEVVSVTRSTGENAPDQKVSVDGRAKSISSASLAPRKAQQTKSEQVLPEEARLLFQGLSKHLPISLRGETFVIALTGEITIEPPYTTVAGSTDDAAKVRRILESERSVLPKKKSKRNAHVPLKGG